MRCLLLLLLFVGVVRGMDEGNMDEGGNDSWVSVFSGQKGSSVLEKRDQRELDPYEDDKPLRDAFKIKDPKERLSEVLRLLERGENPNGRKPSSYYAIDQSLLSYAASRGWYEETLHLLVYGANPNEKDSYGRTVLRAALCSPRWLVKKNKSEESMEPSRIKVVKLLLVAGADAQEKDLFHGPTSPSLHSLFNDGKIKEMLRDFEKYKTEHPKEFEGLENEFFEAKNMLTFKRQVRLHGLFNVLGGFHTIQGSSICPPPESNSPADKLQENQDGQKRKRE